MVILGLDVGFAITGWAILDRTQPLVNNTARLLDYGAIQTSKELPMQNRLEQIYTELQAIFKKYKPDAMAIESLFYFKNQKTVIGVGQARGVMLLVASLHKVPVFDYTPLQVKTAVTGYGRADKKQIQKMVSLIYKLTEAPKPDDVADAIAVATCHANTGARY